MNLALIASLCTHNLAGLPNTLLYLLNVSQKQIHFEANFTLLPMEFQPLEVFLMNDQPFTCPICGNRCEELANFYHTNARCLIERCLNQECQFTCYEEEDEYYLKLWE